MTNIAIENDPVEIVDFPIENGGAFHSYVSLPEGNHLKLCHFAGYITVSKIGHADSKPDSNNFPSVGCP